MDRIAGCLVIGLVAACALGSAHAGESPAGKVQQVGESIEEAGEDVADWILRLFRGVDDDGRKPKAGSSGGKGGNGGQGTGGGRGGSGGGGNGDDGGGDDGGDDGGGDDGGGDDGGDD